MKEFTVTVSFTDYAPFEDREIKVNAASKDGAVMKATSQLTSEEINYMFSFDVKEMVKCSICNEETEQGFIICGEIHCSEECLQETMTLDEYSKAHDMDEDDYYWTEWHGQEY